MVYRLTQKILFCKLLVVNLENQRFIMANRKNVHVVQRDGGWGTLREGAQRARHVYDTQAQAIEVGRQMAR